MENLHLVKEDELNSVIDRAVSDRMKAEYNKFYNTFITIDGVASMHNVSRQTVINYIKGGMIPIENRSEYGKYQIRMSDALKLNFSELKIRLKIKNKNKKL
ncbi:MAG: hypothetical protein LBP36_03025 [Oscillospiraceae bacterium]|jgi:hypothetical protein|nr:hypothetical protein [Oscillospiraceae bacterium]